MLRNKILSEHVLLVVFARRRAHSAPHADDEHEHAEHVGEIKIFSQTHGYGLRDLAGLDLPLGVVRARAREHVVGRGELALDHVDPVLDQVELVLGTNQLPHLLVGSRRPGGAGLPGVHRGQEDVQPPDGG